MLTPSHHDIHQTIAQLAGSGKAWALAVVLSSQGSTPCKAAAKAIFLDDGTIFGTIGGGAMEAEAGRIAAEAIETGRPVVFDFELVGEGIGDTQPICGGSMRVLVDPTAAAHGQVYTAAAAARNHRTRGALITRVASGTVSEVSVEFVAEEDVDRQSTVLSPGVLRSLLQKDEPTLVVDETEIARRMEILVEPLVPAPLLIIVGAGHVGQAVAWQADTVGFEVVVLDDRQEFLGADRFPQAATFRCGPMDRELDSLPVTHDLYVVIVTRGHQHDAEVLAACLGKSAAFVGMIGSRRKVAQMRKDFIASGRATAETFDRVYAPIGLDIGATTVPEIAASIVAQLIAVRRCGTAPRIGVS